MKLGQGGLRRGAAAYQPYDLQAGSAGSRLGRSGGGGSGQHQAAQLLPPCPLQQGIRNSYGGRQVPWKAIHRLHAKRWCWSVVTVDCSSHVGHHNSYLYHLSNLQAGQVCALQDLVSLDVTPHSDGGYSHEGPSSRGAQPAISALKKQLQSGGQGSGCQTLGAKKARSSASVILKEAKLLQRGSDHELSEFS